MCFLYKSRVEERGQQETRGDEWRWREVVKDENSHSLELERGGRGGEEKQKECIFLSNGCPDRQKTVVNKRRNEREKNIYILERI